ncbi:hypothetical protein GCL60_03015 [Silvanigrella paludirubra]|uniref:Outer membrane beta-barrel protein n=1 Tax=Silvanigrella paludirubra TaxID=2499159 RepID=A0A6N6VYM8_9BACT|nr:hypothetical protein [Silvanigrella paludirubra]KAB8040917.1 hypothetical protein GCL60_03015 [Silvanigrella paludirubra]
MKITKKIKYSSFLVTLIFIILNLKAFSLEKNLDITPNLGYTHLEGFSFQRTGKIINKFNGLNLGVSALYSFDSQGLITPVLGAGYNYVGVSNKNNLESGTFDTYFSYHSLVANGGFKLNIFKNISIHTLANLGYSFANTVDVTTSSNSQFVKRALDKTSFEIKNHYFYGVTLMGAYKFNDTFSMGSSFIYNRHSMTLDYITPPETIQENSSFNEYSANLIASWSL